MSCAANVCIAGNLITLICQTKVCQNSCWGLVNMHRLAFIQVVIRLNLRANDIKSDASSHFETQLE